MSDCNVRVLRWSVGVFFPKDLSFINLFLFLVSGLHYTAKSEIQAMHRFVRVQVCLMFFNGIVNYCLVYSVRLLH